MSARLLVAIGILVWIAAQCALACSYPLFAEDWTELEVIRGFGSVWEIFTTNHPPPRPLQHLEFYAATHWTSTAPWAMRLPLYLLHLGSIAGCAALARALGLARGAVLAATALFALYPATTALVYPASTGMVGRTTFAIWALAALAGSARRRWLAPVAVAFGTIALLFHQGAVALVPLFVLLGVLGVHSRGQGTGNPWQALVRPAPLAFAGVVAIFFLLTMHADSPHTSLRNWPSIAGNAAKAAFAVFPSDVRHFVVEGLRGNGGSTPFAIAAAGLGVLALAALLTFWRGSALTRFCILAIAIDLAIPIATAGYSQLYTLLSGALASILVVDLLTRHRRFVPVGIVLALGWAFDSVDGALGAKDAGETVERILTTTANACARLPAEKRLVLCDVPLTWGRERDLMVLHWGLPEALAARGAPRAFAIEQIRTRPFPGGTRARLVDPAELARLRQDPAVRFLEYDPLRKDLTEPRGGAGAEHSPR